jgi:hypothetical protein
VLARTGLPGVNSFSGGGVGGNPPRSLVSASSRRETRSFLTRFEAAKEISLGERSSCAAVWVIS